MSSCQVCGEQEYVVTLPCSIDCTLCLFCIATVIEEQLQFKIVRAVQFWVTGREFKKANPKVSRRRKG